MTTIAAAPAGGRSGNERAEPETRVAEAHLLHDDDLPVDVEAVVVGLLAPADEHELALDAAGGVGGAKYGGITSKARPSVSWSSRDVVRGSRAS